MVLQPASRQLPRGVEELDVVSFGPLGEYRLFRDEAVSAIGGALVELILGTLVPAAGLVVVVGNLSVAFGPERDRKHRQRYNFP